MLMGKNTLIRRSIKVHAEATGNDKIKAIIPLLQVSPPLLQILCLFIVFSSDLVLPLLVD
jgi:hypothetical protein